MSDAAPSPVLDWRHALADIPVRGFDVERFASADERRAVAEALDIVEVRSLMVRYRVSASGRSRESERGAHVAGELEAEVVQTCVVTLEPVTETVREPIAVEFRDAAAIDAAADIDPDEEADLDRLDSDGSVPVGRVVYEVLAAGLDPFPRAPGAEVTWTDTTPEGAVSPFAALERLRARKKESE